MSTNETEQECYLGSEFRTEKVLARHDGEPVMAVYSDVTTGVVYLALATDETEDSWTYLLTPLAGGMDDPVLKGERDLREAYLPPRTLTVDEVVLTWHPEDNGYRKEIERTVLDAAKLTNDQLSMPGARLTPKD